MSRSPNKDPVRRRWLWVLFACAALAVLCVAGFVGLRFVFRMVGDLPGAAASLPAQIEAAQREQLPLTSADLGPLHPVPLERHVARFLVQLPQELPVTDAKLRVEMRDVQRAMQHHKRL